MSLLEQIVAVAAREWVRQLALVQEAEISASESDVQEIESVEVEPIALLEISERAYDRLLTRLNALDAILVGILVAALAIGGIAIDKYSDIGDGLWWLLPSYLISAIGLLIGNAFRRPPDPDPVDAVIGLARRGELGVEALTGELGDKWKKYRPLQPWKMGLAFAGLLFLTMGTIAITREKVVNSHYEEQVGCREGKASQDVPCDGETGTALPEGVWDIRRPDRAAWLLLVRSTDRSSHCIYQAQIACLATVPKI